MSTHRATTSTRRGFTILELLIVVVMMGILATMSVGKTGSIMTNWRVNRAAQAYSEDLQLAFALVGRNRKPIVIEFNKDSMNLTIRSRTDAAGNTVVFNRRNFGPSSEYKLDAANMTFWPAPTGISPNTKSTLEVYPPGLAADSLSMLISYNRFGVAKRVRMLRGGLVQLCSTKDVSKC
jgi:prepilin-type N-terminal cleavage/methylation domain-containing protein